MQNQRYRSLVGFWGAVLALVLGIQFTTQARDVDYRLFYNQAHFSKPSVFDSLMARMKFGARLGYNGMIITDHAFSALEKQSATYFSRVKQAKAEAKRLKTALIPWYNMPAAPGDKDFNLAEAFPVRGTKFVVSNGEARAVGDHDIKLVNPGFENDLSGWALSGLSGGPNAGITTGRSGKGFRVVNAPANARIRQPITMKPFRAYKISAWVKTQNVKHTADVGFRVYGGGVPLLQRRDIIYRTPIMWSPIARTMNWRKVVIDFNSLQNTGANIEFWFGRRANTGTIWLDDVLVEEVGLYEAVNRPSSPVVVRSADKKTVYVEGKDYAVDPKCKNFIKESYNHQAFMRIPAGSRIQNGQELRVDWYQFANVETMEPSTDFCLQKSWSAMDDDFRRIDELFYGESTQVFLNIDEWRVGFWNPNCEMIRAKNGGEYLAGVTSLVQQRLRRINSKRHIYSHQDMHDPYHNARPTYCMVNGGTSGSWEGLDNATIMVNWNPNRAEQSQRFFAGMDPKYPNVKVPQIISVMDAGGISNRIALLKKLEKEGAKGFLGFMFVTWWGDYGHMAGVANTARSLGYWGSGPLPNEVGIADKKGSVNARSLQKVVVSKAGRFHHIRYHTQRAGMVTLRVLDAAGREVVKLATGEQKAGSHQMNWDSSVLSAGIYMVQLQQDGSTVQRVRVPVF